MQELDRFTEEYGGTPFSESLRCPVCQGVGNSIDRVRTINPSLKTEFDLTECGRCKHWWITPMPAQGMLDHLYSRGSRSVLGGDLTRSPKRRVTTPERMVLRHEASSRRGAYLELGVGGGLLYSRFLQLGWDCEGVEPGNWASHLSGVRRTMGELTPNKVFDVVVALDVLEHLEDPLAMLARLYEAGAAGTRLYCSFPNRDSVRARFSKGRWRMVRPIGHLHFWSDLSIRETLSRSRWSVRSLSKTDLWSPAKLASAMGIPSLVAEMTGLGDQWLVMALRRE